MTKISVIIPVYNVEKYLGECLDSVISQSLDDIEIICVNDGSTDNSAEILNEYAQKDNRIRIITQENSGIAVARNKGMEHANGEYIFFLDSDDYIHPNILETLYNTTLETASDFVMSKSEAYPDDKNKANINFANELNDGFLRFKPIKNCKITKEIFTKIIEEYPCVAWGNLYKKSFLDRNNLKFIDKNVIHEDNGFFIKVCVCKPIFSAINELGVMYRIRSKSIMTSTQDDFEKRKKSMKKVLEDTFKYIKKHSKESKFYIEQIKNSPLYSIYGGYDFKIPFLYRCLWSKNNKRIKILFLTIFREKINNGKYIIKIFGIPVWIKKIQEEV